MSALAVLAGGDEYELAVEEINALHLQAQLRLHLAAHSLGQPPAGAVPPTAVPAADRRRPFVRPSDGVDVGRGARAPRPVRPSSRRPRAGTGPAAGGPS